ncbi:hypothetical protein J6590_006180 [Homalodisca vitripennis]|nr:hypothetical protein J6590_006180 [Homalodisca vitripennis]
MKETEQGHIARSALPSPPPPNFWPTRVQVEQGTIRVTAMTRWHNQSPSKPQAVNLQNCLRLPHPSPTTTSAKGSQNTALPGSFQHVTCG